MLSLLFALSFFTFSKTVELSPVEIEAPQSETQSSRSVQWPVTPQKLTPAVLLPQWDDAINSTNGLQTRTQGSPTFSIRGSAQSGRVLVLYDHTPLNFASGFGAPQIFLPKETLQQINVIKGPSSLFFGSQAMSGAIDFISKEYQTPELNINFSDTNESFLPWRKGSLAHQSYQLATPLYSSARSHWQSSFFYEDDDGQFPFQNNNASGVRQFNAQNLSRLVLKGSHQREHWRWDFNSILGRQILQSPGAVTLPLPTRQESDGVLVSLTPQVFFNDQSSLKSRFTFLKSEAEFKESNTPSYTHLTTGLWQNEWVYDFNQKTKLQFFADAFFHRLDSSFSGDDLKQNNFEAGPFLSFQLFENFTHQIGGRYLSNSGQFLPTVSTHFLFQSVDSWISYAEGFRNPSLSDLYSLSPFFVGNSDLDPEQSKQWEMGVKNQNPQNLGWEVRLFQIEYQNFIESFEVSPGVFSRANRGSGYSRGLDTSLQWQRGWVRPEASYNYLDTRSRDLNRPFRLSPRHQINIGSSFLFSSFQFQIQNTHWYDSIDVSLNQAVPLQDWQQWNLFFHYMDSEKFRVSLGLINAFNQGKQLTLNYPEPQRKYWLQIHQSF